MPRTQRPESQPHHRALPIPSKVFPAGFVCHWAQRDTGAWRGKLRRQPGLWHFLGTRALGRSEPGGAALAQLWLEGCKAGIGRMLGMAALGCGWRVVERAPSQLSALCSCFWGGGKHSVAGLSPENLEHKVRCALRGCRGQKGHLQTRSKGAAGTLGDQSGTSTCSDLAANKSGKREGGAPRVACSMARVLCCMSNLAREEGHLQLRKSGLWTHGPQIALEKDIVSLHALRKHANPPLPSPLFAWFVEISNGRAVFC